MSGYNPSSPPKAGDNNPLQCQMTGGNPLPTLRWTRDGVAVLDSQIQTDTSGSTVTSQLTGPLVSGDNGREFVCTEEQVVAPNPPRSDSETLTVYFPPSTPSIDYTGSAVTAGDSFTATCQTSTGNPTPTLTWYLGGSDTPVGTPGTGSSQLVINPLTKDNNGQVYVCRATNAATGVNPPSAEITLLVHYKPDLTISPLSPVDEMTSLTLTCTADSNPDVTSIGWTHVTSGRDVPGTVQRNVLTSTILEVTYEDAGNYRCSATNSVGQSAELVDVIINYAPKFTHTKSKYAMGLRQNVTMECSAVAYPTPITFSWSMGGTEITTGVSSQDGVSTLTIVGIESADYGNYTCTAMNHNGNRENSAIFHLVAETAPEPSKDLDYTKKTFAGVVTLTWTAEFNGGLETTHTVQYRMDGTIDWVSGPSVVEAASQNRPEFTENVDLPGKGRYEIRIRAQNSQGAVESNVIQVLVEDNKKLYGTLAITSVEYTEGICDGELGDRIVTQLDSIFDSYKGYEGAKVTGCRSGSVLADFEATVAQSEAAAAQTTYTENIADGQLGEFTVDHGNSRIDDVKPAGPRDSTTVIIIAVVVSIVVLIAVAVAVIFLVRRQRTGDKSPVNGVELDHVAGNADDGYQSLRIPNKRKSDHTYQGLMARSESQIPDEATYEDVKTSAEFPRNQLSIKEEIGQGEFGSVHRAEAWNLSGHEGVTVVAVKAMKAVTSPAALSAFFKELSVLKQIGTHPNVVSFLGCCTDTEPFYLLLEFVSGGSLQSTLRTSRTQQTYGNLHGGSKSLSPRDLTRFAWHVAKGMSFLSAKKILHRDLASRNVLVSADRTCKVSDFGFSREGDEYERTTKTRLPVRWMAPESLFHRKYTTKSDVWAFGVLLWEIITLGATPYPGMSKREVMDGVQQGYRMGKPPHCDDKLYTLMLSCWDAEPTRRPEFRKIQRSLDSLMEAEHDYINLASLDENTYTSLQNAADEKY